MALNKNLKDELVHNLRMWLNSLKDKLKNIITKIKNAETINEIMALKKDLLLMYVNEIPLTAKECYFCIGYVCEECPYAEYHGICEDKYSEYSQIKDAVDKLKTLIDEKYYDPNFDNYEDLDDSIDSLKE